MTAALPKLVVLLTVAVDSAHGFHPYYPEPVARSIQRWEISTLREQIKAHHVKHVAFHANQRAVEVLDVNGLQRRVDIFPPVVDLLVDDLHAEHVPFFVAPEPVPSPIVPFVQAFLATLFVLWVIVVLGMTDAFVMGCIIMGAVFMQFSQQIDQSLTAAFSDLRKRLESGKSKHDGSLEALMLKVRDVLGFPIAYEVEPIRVRVEESLDELDH